MVMTAEEIVQARGTMKAEILKRIPDMWVDIWCEGDTHTVHTVFRAGRGGKEVMAWDIPDECSLHQYLRRFHVRLDRVVHVQQEERILYKTFMF
jgi:hypothetical protein